MREENWESENGSADMTNRITHADEYDRIDTMTGAEREALIKRTARVVFDEEFSRDTTQAAIYRTAEAVVHKLDVKKIIKDTAVEVALEAGRAATEASRETATHIAKETARELKEAFSMMDMDPSSRDDMREFRSDIRFVRTTRKIIGDSWSKAIGLVIVAIMGAAIYGAWTHISNGPPQKTEQVE